MNTEIPDRNNPKEFALHISAVTAAFAYGKPIQFKSIRATSWDHDCTLALGDYPEWDWCNRDYRIAPTPQPTHEAWTFADAPPVVKVRRKSDGRESVAYLCVNTYALQFDGLTIPESASFDDLLRDFVQLDDTPCGVKREEVEPEEYEYAYSEKRETIFRRSRRDNGWEAMVLSYGQKWNRSRGQEPMLEFLASDFACGEYAAIPAHEAHALIAKGGAK